MARIAGVDLPRDKRVEIGLTYIYGVGRSRSNEILQKANVDPNTRVKDLTEAEVNALRGIIDEYHVEGDLRRDIALHHSHIMSAVDYDSIVLDLVDLGEIDSKILLKIEFKGDTNDEV